MGLRPATEGGLGAPGPSLSALAARTPSSALGGCLEPCVTRVSRGRSELKPEKSRGWEWG